MTHLACGREIPAATSRRLPAAILLLAVTLVGCARHPAPAAPSVRGPDLSVAPPSAPPIDPALGCYTIRFTMDSAYVAAGFMVPSESPGWYPARIELISRRDANPMYSSTNPVKYDVLPEVFGPYVNVWWERRGDTVRVVATNGHSGAVLRLLPDGRDLRGRGSYLVDVGPPFEHHLWLVRATRAGCGSQPAR